MANNRMYLVHRPTGLAVFLGKRMEYGWYDGENIPVQKLFDALGKLDYADNQDDFAIYMESAVNAPMAIDDWYGCKTYDGDVLQITLKSGELNG